MFFINLCVSSVVLIGTESRRDGDLRIGAGDLVHAFRGHDIAIHDAHVLRVEDAEGLVGFDVYLFEQDVGDVHFRQAPDDAGAAALLHCGGDVAEHEVAINRRAPGDRRGGIFRGDLRRELVQVAILAIGRHVAGVNHDRTFDVRHAQVQILHVVDKAAAVAVGLDADAVLRAVESAINHGDVRHAALRVAADAHAVAEAVGAVRDEHVRRIAAAGEIVVARADVAVLDEDVAALHVAGIGVVARQNGIVRGGSANLHAADGDIGAIAAERDVKHRRVGQRDALDEQPLAVRRRDHLGPLRILVCFSERPPRRALSVNRARAGDGDVVQLVAADEGLGIARAAGIFAEWQHPQQGTGFEVQIDLARQFDRAAEKNSGGNLHHAAARLARCINGGLDGASVRGHIIADRAVVGDIERGRWNHGQSWIDGVGLNGSNQQRSRQNDGELILGIVHEALLQIADKLQCLRI